MKPTGDSICIFNSRGCSADNCTINGTMARYACAAIIDGPAGKGNTLSKLTIADPAGRVGICGGAGHCLCDTIVPGAVEVTGEYYARASVTGCKLLRVTSPELYVGRRVSGLTKTACNFGAK